MGGKDKGGHMGVMHGKLLAAEEFPPSLVHWLQHVAPSSVPRWYPGQALTEILAGKEACPLCLFEETSEVALHLKKHSPGDWIAAQGTLFIAGTFVACHLAEPALQTFVDKIDKLDGERANLTHGLFELIASFEIFLDLFTMEQLSAIAYLAIQDLSSQIKSAGKIKESGGEQLFEYARRETISEIINMLETVNATMPIMGKLLRKDIRIPPRYAFELVAEYLKLKMRATENERE
jgi:hypothetical protein